jgi:NAD+ synthase (glutamine-hydrolysing)
VPHEPPSERAGTRDDESVKALLTAMSSQKGAIEANLERHLSLLAEGVDAGARIVVFPEMSLTGSVDPVHWPGHAIGLAHPAVAWLADATGRLGVAALFGIAEVVGDDVCITQVLADGGRVLGHYRKRTRGVGEESYRAGSETAQFSLDGAPIGIAICAETGADAPFDDAAAAGARVVFACSAPGLYGRRTTREEWGAGFRWWTGAVLGDATRHARRLGLWIALSTQAGSTADEDFPGFCAVVDPTGTVVAALPDWHESTLLADLP